MLLSVIVAVAENGVVGRDNSLPWHIPEDLKYFKRTTLGKPVVMGRKTFESIGRALPGRTNIVVTRNREWRSEGVRVVHSLEAALELGREVAATDGAAELMVIGGAGIYAAAIPLADRLYVTEVHGHYPGDACMPEVDWTRWRELSRERHSSDASDGSDYSFVVWERVAPAAGS